MIDSRLGRLRLLEIFLQMTDFHGEQVYKWEPSYLWIEIHAHTSIQPFPYLTKPKFKKKKKKENHNESSYAYVQEMEQDQKHTGTCTFIDKWTTLKLLSGMKKTLNEKVI